MREEKQNDFRCVMHTHQRLILNVNIIHHNYEVKIITVITKMGRRFRHGEREQGCREGIKKESYCIMHMYLLLKINANFMYCIHVLIKISII